MIFDGKIKSTAIYFYFLNMVDLEQTKEIFKIIDISKKKSYYDYTKIVLPIDG